MLWDTGRLWQENRSCVPPTRPCWGTQQGGQGRWEHGGDRAEGLGWAGGCSLALPRWVGWMSCTYIYIFAIPLSCVSDLSASSSLWPQGNSRG